MALIEVQYQAGDAASGRTVQMDVYKPDHTKDDGQSCQLTEIGSTGRYYGSFDADVPNWSVQIADDAGGKTGRLIGVPEFGILRVIDLVADVQTAVGAVATAINNLQSQVTGDIDEVKTDTGNIIAATTAMISQLGNIVSKIDALKAPPQVL